MLPSATWMPPGACPDFHSLLSRTSSRVAPSRARSRACAALTFEPRRPSAGCPPKSRRSRSRTEGVGVGVDEVVKVGSVRHAQHTLGGICLNTTRPGHSTVAKPCRQDFGKAGEDLCPFCQLGQRDRGVGQAFDVDGCVAADERLDAVTLIPDVGVHPGQDAPVLEPEGEELSSRFAPRTTIWSQSAAKPLYSMPKSYWSE